MPHVRCTNPDCIVDTYDPVHSGGACHFCKVRSADLEAAA